jgi:hypothetical protein
MDELIVASVGITQLMFVFIIFLVYILSQWT